MIFQLVEPSQNKTARPGGAGWSYQIHNKVKKVFTWDRAVFPVERAANQASPSPVIPVWQLGSRLPAWGGAGVFSM